MKLRRAECFAPIGHLPPTYRGLRAGFLFITATILIVATETNCVLWIVDKRRELVMRWQDEGSRGAGGAGAGVGGGRWRDSRVRGDGGDGGWGDSCVRGVGGDGDDGGDGGCGTTIALALVFALGGGGGLGVEGDRIAVALALALPFAVALVFALVFALGRGEGWEVKNGGEVGGLGGGLRVVFALGVGGGGIANDVE